MYICFLGFIETLQEIFSGIFDTILSPILTDVLTVIVTFATEEYEKLVIHEVVLNKSNQENNQKTLDEFFRLHPKATLGVVFNSRVYQLGEYLRSAGRSMKGLIGYDLLKANVELLKSGDVHYLIGQRPGLQGYCGVKALCVILVQQKMLSA